MAIKRSPVTNYERLHAFEAGTDLSTKGYTFAQFDSDGKVEPITSSADTVAATKSVHCVVINGSKAGDVSEVLTAYGDRVNLQMGATNSAVNAGDKLTLDKDGYAKVLIVPATRGNAALHYHAVVVGADTEAHTGTAAIGRIVDAIYLPNTVVHI